VSLTAAQRSWLKRAVDRERREQLARAACALVASRRNPAESFLREALADGERPGVDVVDEARRIGIPESALKQAKRRLGITQRFDPNLRCWTWRLPEGP
jgi:hypothetical protein